MKKFEILEHTADLKIRAFGKTQEELFKNMMLGMEESLHPEIIDSEIVKRNINITSSGLGELLVDFLNEINYLNQINFEVYDEINFEQFSVKVNKCILKAKLIGKKVKRFNEDIKGVTYHDLEIKKGNNLWQAIVLFDI